MNKNDIITLSITSTSTDGYGIGRHNGMAVFVPNTAEGDIAEVKILKVKKNYAYGKAERLIEKSKHRIDSDCDVFAQCGGCVYRHITYEKECEIKTEKVADCINRIGGINLKPQKIIALENNIYGYRNKTQLPISENGNTGFFAVHSHRIIETDKCFLSPDIFNTVSKTVCDWIKKYKISVYNETEHRGLIRRLYLRMAKATDEIMVVLVINGNILPHSAELLNNLKNILGERLCSFQININKNNTNVILGDICKVLYGKSYITDILCDIKIQISPLSFYQINRDMTELLYKKAAEYAKPENKNIIDLYCGAGTIGLSMAKSAKSILGVEIIPQAVENARVNASENGIKNAEFICADATSAAQILAKKQIPADVVILDPPRKGCSEELLNTVAKSFSPERIVYISCDPSTLARDCKILNALGYSLKEYTPADLFPRTCHIECVCLLTKAPK